MEFIMQTDIATVLPKAIDFNFEALKEELTARLEYYNNLVITEDSIKDGKDDRAKLNKLKEALETRRKEVKKEWMKPCSDFEAKVKEIVALIDQPILAIDTQLKDYEEKRKEEKQQEIAEAYSTIIPDVLKDIIPLDKIMKPQWLNATTKMKKVEEELADIAKRTNADMMVLDTVEDEYKAAVREHYIRTLDIAGAMDQRNSLLAAAAAFRQREEERANNQPIPQTKTQPEAKNGAETEGVSLLYLEFQLTRNQADLLKAFLVENNINHRKIDRRNILWP